MSAARVRIGKITLKRDGRVFQLHGPRDWRLRIEDRVRHALLNHGPDVAGFAFVVWQGDCASTGDLEVYSLGIPRLMAPEFVRRMLETEVTYRWVMQGLAQGNAGDSA